jgi:hypothetical protein
VPQTQKLNEKVTTCGWKEFFALACDPAWKMFKVGFDMESASKINVIFCNYLVNKMDR